MDDAMIELMTGDSMLRRRLEAYAVARLDPDLAATARIRARVLAVAHRQADLARADAALAVLPRTGDAARARGRATRPGWRRVAPAVLAAALGVSALAGVALAARPGGPLYGAHLWVETLGLPSEPSARAIAALARLETRLEEAAAASAAGDEVAVAAAVAAYAAIVDAASTDALLADDAVAEAALAAGMARNIEVLQALITRVPAGAATAIAAALEAAIDRSGAAIDAIERATGGGTRETPGRPGGAADPDSPTSGGGATDDNDATPAPTPTPKPAKSPKPEPTVIDADPTPSAHPTPDPAHAAEPTRTPRPTKSPPGKPDEDGDQKGSAGNEDGQD